jgi:ribulose 1,5-bisphosphate carboxylase large subunit-like protein
MLKYINLRYKPIKEDLICESAKSHKELEQALRQWGIK